MGRLALLFMLCAASLARAEDTFTCSQHEIAEHWDQIKLKRVLEHDVGLNIAGVQQARQYIVSGDIVATYKHRNGSDCAIYVGKEDRVSTGWLAASALVVIPQRQFEAKDFVGRWTWGDRIDVKPTSRQPLAGAMLEIEEGKKAGTIRPKATAFYASTWNNLQKGGPKFGLIGTDSPVELSVLHNEAIVMSALIAERGSLKSLATKKSQPICVARFRLLDPDHLIAMDNGACGAKNVSFTGLYLREKRPILQP